MTNCTGFEDLSDEITTSEFPFLQHLILTAIETDRRNLMTARDIYITACSTSVYNNACSTSVLLMSHFYNRKIGKTKTFGGREVSLCPTLLQLTVKIIATREFSTFLGNLRPARKHVTFMFVMKMTNITCCSFTVDQIRNSHFQFKFGGIILKVKLHGRIKVYSF